MFLGRWDAPGRADHSVTIAQLLVKLGERGLVSLGSQCCVAHVELPSSAGEPAKSTAGEDIEAQD